MDLSILVAPVKALTFVCHGCFYTPLPLFFGTDFGRSIGVKHDLVDVSLCRPEMKFSFVYEIDMGHP